MRNDAGAPTFMVRLGFLSLKGVSYTFSPCEATSSSDKRSVDVPGDQIPTLTRVAAAAAALGSAVGAGRGGGKENVVTAAVACSCTTHYSAEQ